MLCSMELSPTFVIIPLISPILAVACLSLWLIWTRKFFHCGDVWWTEIHSYMEAFCLDVWILQFFFSNLDTLILTSRHLFQWVSLINFLFAAELAEMLSVDMQKEGLSGRTLTLKLKTASFEVLSVFLMTHTSAACGHFRYMLNRIWNMWMTDFLLHLWCVSCFVCNKLSDTNVWII